MDNAETMKVTVTLPTETVADIQYLSARLRLTPGELLSRAVQIEKYLDDVEWNNGKVLVERADRRIEQITRK